MPVNQKNVMPHDTHGGMTHDDIKAALAEKGYSLSAASEAMGRSYLQLYNTTNRKTKSRYVARSLAVLLDMPIEEIFPDCPEYSEKKVNKSQKAIDAGRAKLIEAGLMTA